METQAKPHIENDYRECWCGYGGHFTMHLSREGFIQHINECEKKLCDRIKDKKRG